MTSRIQLNFNAGEIDPDAHERVDLNVYDAGLALAENVIMRPHGGVASRPGLQRMGRARSKLVPLDDVPVVTHVNGGDLDAEGGLVTDTAMTAATDYVIAEFTFASVQSISAVDVVGYYFDDESENAGGDEGGGGNNVSPSQPIDPLPGYEFTRDFNGISIL